MQNDGYFCPTLTAREFGLRIWVKFRPVVPEFVHVETDERTGGQTDRKVETNNTLYIIMGVFTYTCSQKHNNLSDSITM
jgi:hypothetical protein